MAETSHPSVCMQKAAIVLPTYLGSVQRLPRRLDWASRYYRSIDLPGCDLVRVSATAIMCIGQWMYPHDWQRPGRESPGPQVRTFEWSDVTMEGLILQLLIDPVAVYMYMYIYIYFLLTSLEFLRV